MSRRGITLRLLKKAWKLAQLEAMIGVHSTWFVLVSSDFYNPFSKDNIKLIKEIVEVGHYIGLHFDESAYGGCSVEQKIKAADEERNRLEIGIGVPIHSISLHRPSKKMIDQNLKFEKMINSYSDLFFHEFKYLSDSRQRWREPVEKIIESRQYAKLHILTHAFWYNELGVNLHDGLLNFINKGNLARYEWMEHNITNLGDIIDRGEVK